jgi:uncharacterized protein
MAELVKIPPQSIGVGQYQHDINKGLLDRALTGVVENCVNRVGVDLNTASASLLSYVAGVNAAIAKNIVSWREENGRFDDRRQLKKVPKLGDKAFDQCAGFLRISEGKNPLDGTSVHPESYGAAAEILKRTSVGESEISAGGVPDIEERICAAYAEQQHARTRTDAGGGRARVKGFAALAPLASGARAAGDRRDEAKLGESLKKLAEDIGVGLPTLRDIVAEIRKPARDPREDAPPVVFRRDVKSFEDMKVGMEFTGTVRNVVDFGAFVDIGVKNDGLVHISRMSDRYVRHPMDVVSVGDTVKVWIVSIDAEKQKIGLSMQKLPEG